jgi:hypothetical protein
MGEGWGEGKKAQIVTAQSITQWARTKWAGATFINVDW